MKTVCSAILLLSFILPSCAQVTSQKDHVPQPAPSTSFNDIATFANGCFWCTEAIFEQLKGVVKVTSGYMGGNTPNPTYETVSAGTTGYAECLQIMYDSTIITYDELLEVFWETHDPTTLNRQGADIGTQYRSAVFYHTPAQQSKAEHYKNALNTSGVYSKPVVTEITRASKFYPAEDYHQSYYRNNANAPYCRAVITPKIEKFRKVFKSKLKE
ncbi:MAG TPA: peptide-methionine (S)-S-oxide reductase MsrA [Ferruginibacter sp.]|nr:peptide-methionine (S)-S-oxide reductase MsrA [Ferruginibacter sp.]HRO05561.1 peptide-methionine (S)-S-oxide reductase MsrA [Ferruginibacter sp.]HRO96311.1 peptide-methionine (S)-S-oxide reductase MsrA [Ferruginibacter sp.]HRP49395.1 peptide-methionine (S)-S-oxide reductase MsrA [Ferruginibacter sp.]